MCIVGEYDEDPPQTSKSNDKKKDGKDPSSQAPVSESQTFFEAGTSLVKAALSRASRYQQLVDTDDLHETKTKSVDIENTPPKTRDAAESSSSYAEDDHPGLNVDKNKVDFSYKELDDEYGSRPVPVAKFTKRRETDVSSGQETSGHRTSGQDVPTSDVQINMSDRIMGHEYGVRPLLDDDELEDAYGTHHHGNKEVLYSQNNDSTPSSNTVSPQTGSSPALSPSMEKYSSDPFASAPFRKKIRKKRPSSAALPGATKTVPDTDIFSKAPFRPKFLTKSKTHHGIGSPLQQSESDKIQTEGDIFGNAPFQKQYIETKTSEFSAEVIPMEETRLYANVTQTQNPSVIEMNNKNIASQPFIHKPVLNSDVFGAVPFRNVNLNRQSHNIGMSMNSSQTPPSSSQQDTSKGFMNNQTLYKKQLSSAADNSYKPLNDPDGEFGENAALSSQYHQQAEDLLIGMEGDDESDDENDPYGLNRSKGKTKSRKSPRDYANAAFSNMSFNDDDENADGDDESFPMKNTTFQSNLRTMNNPSQSLNVSSIRHPAYTKDPPPQSVVKASNEAMKISSGGYDTFTWPRKHRKIPTLTMATNEPFSSKKKVDSTLK